MTGSNPFSIDKASDSFNRSFKKLYRATAEGLRSSFINEVDSIIGSLADVQRPLSSSLESLPKKITLPPLCEFRKIRFTLSKGASGQIRLMYLVYFDARIVKPLLIYSHKQFSKRPPDKDLADVIKSVLEP